MSRRAAAFVLCWFCFQGELGAEVQDDAAFLQSEQRRAAWWNWSWRGVFTAGVGVSVVQLALEDNEDKNIVHQVALAKGALALFNSFVFDLDIPDAGPGGVGVALAEAAENERSGRKIWPHLTGFAVNLGAALYLGIGHDRWGYAAFQGIGGMAITEIRIFTQPTRAARRIPVTVAPLLDEHTTGLSFVGSF